MNDMNDIVHYNTILHNCVKYFPQRTRDILKKIMEDNMDIDEFTLTILLKLPNEDEETSKIMENLINFIRNKIEVPNLKVMSTILKYYIDTKNKEKVSETFEFLLNQFEYPLDARVYRLLFSQEMTNEEILEMLNKLEEKSIKPNKTIFKIFKNSKSLEIQKYLMKYFGNKEI
jgi:hypothetical protein